MGGVKDATREGEADEVEDHCPEEVEALPVVYLLGDVQEGDEHVERGVEENKVCVHTIIMYE